MTELSAEGMPPMPLPERTAVTPLKIPVDLSIPESKAAQPIAVAQYHAAHVNFYLTMQPIFLQMAEHYASKIHHSTLHHDEKPAVTAARARQGIEDMFFRDHSLQDRQTAQFEWGEEADTFRTMIEQNREQIQTVWDKTVGGAETLTPGERVYIAFKTLGNMVFKLNSEQRNHILQMSGYTKEELAEIAKTIAISVPVHLGTWFIEDRVPDAVAVAVGGAMLPAVLPYDEQQWYLKAAMVVGSAAVYYRQYFKKIDQMRDLLEKGEPVVPSPTAALAYFLCRKFLAPEEKNAMKWVVRGGHFANPLEMAKELWHLTLFAPNGAYIHSAGDLTGAAILYGERKSGIPLLNKGAQAMENVLSRLKKRGE